MCWYSGLLELSVTTPRNHHWRCSPKPLQRQGSSTASLNALQAVTRAFWRLATSSEINLWPTWCPAGRCHWGSVWRQRPNALTPWWVVTNRITYCFSIWYIKQKGGILKSTIGVRVTTRNACCRRLMLGQSRRPDALKYRSSELPADLAASGRDKPLCPRQFDSAGDQLLTTRSTCFKHDVHTFLASHLNQKLCYKPHNFVPIYLPTPVYQPELTSRSLIMTGKAAPVFITSCSTLFTTRLCIAWHT